MKRTWYLTLFFVLGMVAEATQSHGAPILAVDINSDRPGVNSPNPSPTEPGFTGWDIASTSGTKTTVISGSTITLTELGGAVFQTRDRQVVADFASSPVGALYRDAIQADGGTNGSAGMQLDISALLPNTQYALTLWTHDAFENGTSTDTVSITDLNTSLVLGGGIYPGSPQVPSDYSTSRWNVVALTDGTGVLKVSLIHSWAGAGPMVGALALNGFEVNAVPEPSSFVGIGMACCFGIAVNLVRRNRRNK